MIEDERKRILEEMLSMSRAMVNILAGSLLNADVQGLSAPQFRILDMVYNGIDKPAECARMLDVTPPAITSLIDKLAEMGFVERKQDSRDRRRVVLGLTPAGRAAVRKVNEHRRSALDRVLKNMRPADVRRLDESLGSFLKSYMELKERKRL